MAKVRRATGIGKVKAKQKRRTPQARVADARKTASKTFASGDRAGMTKWLNAPGRCDVSGVDTKGKGAGKRKTKRVRLTVY